MENMNDSETLFYAHPECVCVNLPVDAISLRLDGVGMEKKVALDGVKIKLGEDCWMCVLLLLFAFGLLQWLYQSEKRFYHGCKWFLPS